MNVEKEVMTIVRGEKITMPLSIVYSNLKAYKLTDVTEIKFCIMDGSGNVLTKTLTDTSVVITDANAGEITVTLEIADTLLLLVKDSQSFEVEITHTNGDNRISKFDRCLNVEDRICA